MPVNLLLITMTLPMMASMLVQALYNIVDSMFVAKISEEALTALSLAFPVQNLMIGVATGTGVGMNALLSRSLGEKDYDRVNKAAGNGILLVLLASVLFILFGIFGSRLFFSVQTDDAKIIADYPKYAGMDRYEARRAMIAELEELGLLVKTEAHSHNVGQCYRCGTTVEPLKKLVDSGLLGWPLTVRISGATGFAWKFFWTGKENLETQPIPEGFDYDMWLGPAPYKPYNRHRTHSTFRGYWDYDGGGLGDMGQHYIDPVQYVLGKDDEFPVKVEVDAPQQHSDAIGIWRSITFTYADGCRIILEGEGFESEGKVPYIEGPLGKVYKGFECTIPDGMDVINELPDPKKQNTDWLECVRTRRKFALNEDNGYHCKSS
mgnify:CR=1 FL=1